MSNRLISGEQVEMSDSADTLNVGAFSEPVVPATPASVKGSYVPTGVAFIDSLLVTADAITHGKAGMLQRAVSYLMIGGFAAVINLISLYFFNDIFFRSVVHLPLSRFVQSTIAFLLASELSIMANFIPNDRITFSRLPGHARSWWARCLRFHSTAIAGTIVTYCIFATLHIWLGYPTLIAQSTGIIIALFFNFTMHHLWTYRHIHPASQPLS